MALAKISAINDHIRVPVVYTRANWADPWTARPNLYCASASRSLGSSIPQATLQYEYGNIQGAGTSFAVVGPLDIEGHWVKIEWTPHIGTSNFDFVVDSTAELALLSNVDTGQRAYNTDDGIIYEYNGSTWDATIDAPTAGLQAWYGIATEQTLQQLNFAAGSQAGTQIVTCQSIEWLFSRQQVLDTVVEDVAGVSVKRIPIGLPFNGNNGTSRFGLHNFANQSNTPDVNGVQIFASSMNNPRKWNAKDIIEHLLAYHVPFDSGPLIWELSAAANDQLSWYEPINLETHGRTVWDLLNTLISPRRGLCWWIEVDEPNDKFLLHTDSLLAADLTLPVSGTTVSENQNQVHVDYDNTAGVRQPHIRRSLQRRYEQVIVEGARRGAVCTLGKASGELQDDWDSADEASYASAASGLGYYAGYGLADRKAINDGHRSHEEKLSRVYTHFRIKPDWDLKAYDGNSSSASSGEWVLKELDGNAEDVSPEAADVTWIDGIRVESYLPLLKTHDYTDPTTPVDDSPADAAREYRQMFATFALEAILGSPNEHNTKRELLDKLHSRSHRESDTEGAGFKFNARVRPQDGQPGLIVEGSAPAHCWAKNHFNPSSAAPSDYLPQADYDTLAATVYLTFPNHVRVSWPDPPDPASHDQESVLLIRLGDRAHLDYMPPYTVIGVVGDRVQRATLGEYIRDDRQLMRDVARMAYEWYGEARRTFGLQTTFLTSQLQLGSLVRTVNGLDTVNAVVSAVSWDFRAGTTTIETQFAELDFREFVA